MLNVESKFSAFCIWFVIALLCLIFFWSAFQWPDPATMWNNAIQSETALLIERYQTLLGLIIGLGAVATAYLVNGYRDRAAAQCSYEEKNNNLLAAVTTELADLTADCNEKAQDAWVAAQMLENGDHHDARDMNLPEGLFKSIASPLDTTLMDLAPEDLAPLGSNIYSHLRRLRQELRYIEDVIDQVPDASTVLPTDQAAFFKELAKGYMTMSQACAHVKSVCEKKHRTTMNGACCDHGELIATEQTHYIEDMRA